MQVMKHASGDAPGFETHRKHHQNQNRSFSFLTKITNILQKVFKKCEASAAPTGDDRKLH